MTGLKENHELKGKNLVEGEQGQGAARTSGAPAAEKGIPPRAVPGMNRPQGEDT